MLSLKECYDAMGGDYEGVSERLRSENMVRKFALKFLEDRSYDLFCDAMADKNYEEAFRAAHTLKGICQNLGFTRLLKSSSEMSEALRYNRTEEAEALCKCFEADYKSVIEALSEFKNENGGQ